MTRFVGHLNDFFVSLLIVILMTLYVIYMSRESTKHYCDRFQQVIYNMYVGIKNDSL